MLEVASMVGAWCVSRLSTPPPLFLYLLRLCLLGICLLGSSSLYILITYLYLRGHHSLLGINDFVCSFWTLPVNLRPLLSQVDSWYLKIVTSVPQRGRALASTVTCVRDSHRSLSCKHLWGVNQKNGRILAVQVVVFPIISSAMPMESPILNLVHAWNNWIFKVF